MDRDYCWKGEGTTGVKGDGYFIKLLNMAVNIKNSFFTNLPGLRDILLATGLLGLGN